MYLEPKRIAYVEDEPDIRELAELALKAVGGFEVDVYASGADALERLSASPPDIVLLDVMMPEMDGIELFKRLADLGATASVPVIFMTAKSRPDEIRRLKELGAVGVITKPYDPMTLADEIRAIVREAA